MTRSRGWKVARVILLVFLGAAGGLLAVAGAVPGLSGLVGADQPRDLGVQATPADFDRVVQEVELLLRPVPATPTATAGSKVQTVPAVIDREFTEQELSALLSYPRGDDWPLQGGQVRIHADGTLDLSVALVTENLPAEVRRQLPPALPELLPLFVRGRLAVAGAGEVGLAVEQIEVGRMPLPARLVDGLNLTELLNAELQALPGLHLTDLVFAEGRVRVQGTYQP